MRFWSNLFRNKTSKRNFYNDKYPKKNLLYKRTEPEGTYQIDVRMFLNPKNHRLPKIDGLNDDSKALSGLKWIINNITYKAERAEYWSFGYQTQKRKFGDCEDGAILLYDMLRNAGIPGWKLRLSAGWVNWRNKKVGHAYLTYYVEENDRWVILDWCYYPNLNPVNWREDYKNEVNYEKTWFSFNEDYAWAKGLNTDARKVLK